MNPRRRFLQGMAAALALPVAAHGERREELVVYKSASCGCCGEWEKHMRAAGFRVRSEPVADVHGLKRKLGVPERLASCHTAVVAGGYLIEGHVPARDVKRLLLERPLARGLAVPGMPAGSPGMEQGPAMPYDTLEFDASRSWIFERH